MSAPSGKAEVRHEPKTPSIARESGGSRSEALPTQNPLLELQAGAGNQAIRALIGVGRPLPGGLRSEMETRFGADFGGVRVHDHPDAHATAKCCRARAFTYGEDIVFGAGTFSPGATEGRHLLAHELAHVIQQRRGGGTPSGDVGAASEQAARNAAMAIVAGHGKVSVDGATAVGIAREESNEKLPPPRTIEDYEKQKNKKIERIEKKDLTKQQKAKLAKNAREARLGRIPNPEQDAARLEAQKAAEGISTEDSPLSTRPFGGSKGQGREDRQGALRRLAYEKDSNLIPPEVADHLKEQLDKFMAEGRYDETSKTQTLKLPEGYVLGHYEEGEFTAEPHGTPARDGFDYNNSRVITVEQNRRAEALRQANKKSARPKSTGEVKPVPPIVRKKQAEASVSQPVRPKPTNAAKTKASPSAQPAPLNYEPSARTKPAAEPILDKLASASVLAEASKPSQFQTEPIKVAPSIAAPQSKVGASPAPKGAGDPYPDQALTQRVAAPIGKQTPVKTDPALKSTTQQRNPVPTLSSSELAEAKTLRAHNWSAVIGLSAGLLAGYAVAKYREWLESTLAASPPREKEKKAFADYLSKSNGALSIGGLLSTDINGFSENLRQNGEVALSNGAAAVFEVSLFLSATTEKIDRIRQVDYAMEDFVSEVGEARQSVKAALTLESSVRERIAAATDLARWIVEDSVAKGGNLSTRNATTHIVLIYEVGLSLDEVDTIQKNLREHAHMLKKVLGQLHQLAGVIEDLYTRSRNFSAEVNRIYWSEVLYHAAEKNKGVGH